MPDQTINVDIRINQDALNQIPQLKTGLDLLRTSVNNLNKEILKHNEQNKETNSWGTKIKGTIKELGETFDSIQKIITIAKTALTSWTDALTLIFTFVVTYGPEILNFLDNLFQSDKANEAAQALKTYKNIMEAYVEGVSSEISKTQMLVNIMTNKNLGYEAQIEALHELQKLAPEHLKNLTLENAQMKDGKALIDDYIKALNRKAMQEAVQGERVKLIKQRYELKERYDDAVKERIAYNTGKKRSFSASSGYTLNGTYLKGQDKSDKQTAHDNVKELAKQDLDLVNQIKKLDDQLADTLLKYAAQPAINANQKIEKNKEFYEKQLQQQQSLLDKLDANDKKSFEKRAKSIKKEIQRLNGILAAYSAVEKPSPKKTKPKPASQPAFQELEAKGITLEKALEQDKKAYQEEMAVLNRHLEMKLISQEDYQHKSEETRNKYLLGIGAAIKTFQKNELTDTQKHLEDVINAESIVKQGNEAKKKAWTPDQKFEAEKLRIEGQYATELANFKGTEDAKKALADQCQRDITTLTQSYEQQRRDFAMQSAQQVSDAAFSILKNGMQAQSAARLKTLDTQKSAELNNSNLTATQRKAIEDKYKKKEAEEKTRAFKAEQRASILQAVINGALAITKVTAQAGLGAPFVIPGIIASTALQVATIAAQKAPKYAQGGLHYQSDGRGALLPGYSRADDTNAYLRSGEAVVVSEAMRNPWARNLVSAINVAHGGRDFSTAVSSRGFAVGGIFTDGGNANRYYSQPVHDVKDLANTLAYQMINNFPPIYVDVKDVNNQQNILAQTVNRVNL